MAKKKILIVEDEDHMRTILTLELESAGYQVFQAENGEIGYRVAQSVKPDLVISDILMPEVDGNQFMKKFRDNPMFNEIPFIIVSARGQMQDYFEMLEVDDFITKPFEAEDLLSRIEKVLAKAQKKKEGSGEEGKDGGGDRAKRILVVEDNVDTSDKIEHALVEGQYEVDIVKTVPDCLERAATFKPDIIALQFVLDGAQGDKLVTMLKSVAVTRDVPVIVYCKQNQNWEEQNVLDAGAALFVNRSNEEKLLEAIKKLLNKK